jgi:hypothetical protein
MGPSIVRAALALSLSTAPPPGAPNALATAPAAPVAPATAVPEVPPEAVRNVSYAPPTSTWIAAGVAAGLFAAGLAFTLTATSIEQQAGNVNANGVDTGLTRARAVQGQTDVIIGNTLLVGAGLALIAAVTFGVLHAKNLSETAAPPTPAQPLALRWTLP